MEILSKTRRPHGKNPRKMRVSLRCPYGRMTYTGSNGRQNALSAVQPSPTAPIADNTIVLPIIPIPVKFVNIFLLFSLDSRKKSGYNGRRGASPLNPTRGFASGLHKGLRHLTLSRDSVDFTFMLCPRVYTRPHPSLRRHLPQKGRQGGGAHTQNLPLWGRCRRRMRSVLPQ